MASRKGLHRLSGILRIIGPSIPTLKARPHAAHEVPQLADAWPPTTRLQVPRKALPRFAQDGLHGRPRRDSASGKTNWRLHPEHVWRCVRKPGRELYEKADR